MSITFRVRVDERVIQHPIKGIKCHGRVRTLIFYRFTQALHKATQEVNDFIFDLMKGLEEDIMAIED